MSDRMLSDEILLGLIKKNGGGGTTNYNSLSNKPQIAGTELQGNKSLADLGIASAQDVKKEFIGTLDEWNALTTEQQKEYDTYQITNDYSEALMPNYSTVEQKTGQKWIDGSEIYMCTTECEIPANQGQGYTHFVTSVPLDASVIDCEVVVEDSAGHLSLGGYIPWYSPASACFAGLDPSGLNTWFGGNHYAGKTMYVTLWYTKATA